MTITIAIIGVATVVAAASVVVEYKKHIQLKRMNDLLAESLGHEPASNGQQPIQHTQHGQGRHLRCHGSHDATCRVLSHRRWSSKRHLAHLGLQGRKGRSPDLSPPQSLESVSHYFAGGAGEHNKQGGT